MSQKETFVSAIKRWKTDPVDFVNKMLHATPDQWQADMLNAVASGDRGVTVRSGHGVGKRSCLSWLALWWITVHFDSKVVITAHTSAQLHDALLPELKSWLNGSPKDYK